MGGLAHYIEREGIPTTQISLIRKHTETMKPPRALVVPFELGRPFGAPNEPDFQRRVLLACLQLLERNDGPILEDYPEDPPGPPADMEGWTCPVNLAPPAADLSETEAFIAGVKQEIALLRPWYDESVKNFNGRRLDGMTDLSKEEIVDYLMGWIAEQHDNSIVPCQPLGRSLKLCADDLRHFYYQAAMAKPGVKSDVQLGDWFYGETHAGRIFVKLREICLAHENENMQNIGRTNFVPNAMLRHT